MNYNFIKKNNILIFTIQRDLKNKNKLNYEV